MPRFNPDKWKPTDDSSPGHRTDDPRSVVLYRPWFGDRLACPCGCGHTPEGDKAVFRMGHDARFRGILIRAHLMGVKIRWVRDGGGMTEPESAEDIAEDYYWKSYLDSAVMKREGKNREVLKEALNSERLVKVGRWEFTGQVVAVYRLSRQDMFEVKYVDKAGNVKSARVPAADTEEIA